MKGVNIFQLRKVASRLLSKKSFHTSPAARIQKVEEVRIPVPWGHVAGKWWGSKDAQPILALHGWQDNAGSWDPLVKLLPEDYSVLAIDFPGSGFSSHLPPFQSYHFLDSGILIERIKQYYKFDEKMILLGHSGGSAVAFLYSTIFPDYVKGYFGIDYVLYAYTNHENRAKRTGDIIDKAIELALRDPLKAKKYEWDEAVKAWVGGTKGSVSPASAEILMQRGTMKLPDGKVVFTRDNRLKAQTTELMNSTQIENFAENITCNVALVKGSKSHLFQQGIKNVPHIMDIIKKHAKSFEFHVIKGGHHLHMDIPEVILPLFVNFVQKC